MLEIENEIGATMALQYMRCSPFSRMLTRCALFQCRFIKNLSLKSFHTGFQNHMPLIPMVLDKTTNVERYYDIYSRLLKDRIICLMGAVTDEIAGSVIAQLLFLQSEDKKIPIHLYINSPGKTGFVATLSLGGVVTAGLAIYDTMQFIRPPVATLCIGQASSMGSLLLAAGSPGCRFALPHSRIMVHQPSGSAHGELI